MCTHRGNILVKAPCRAEQIRCGYHSRRFDLAGRMLFMPEFAGVRNFPADSDHLPEVPFAQWGGHGFAALAPAAPLAAFLGELTERIGWIPVERFVASPERRRDYEVDAHWALYVENYLEGFHIPFVHGSLAKVIDYGAYTTELFPTAIRGDAFAVANNLLGRVGYVVAPAVVGWGAGHIGWGRAVSLTVIPLVVALVLILARLPETRGRELEETSALGGPAAASSPADRLPLSSRTADPPRPPRPL